MFPLLGIAELIGIIIFSMIIITPFWKIFAKAGFSKWLSLLILFPVVDLVVLYYVGIRKWPIHSR